MDKIEKIFPKGILRPELFMGTVNLVTASIVQVDFSEANAPSGSYYQGNRYGKGEVGEFVLIEGQLSLSLGRVIEVRNKDDLNTKLDAVGKIQLLGSVSMETLKVKAGIDAYPRLGDRVYSSPSKFVSLIPYLMSSDDSKVALEVGYLDYSFDSKVFLTPEKLFGRHLAILGTTGGGKSWTTSRIIEECGKHNSKIILIDATGEYRNMHDVKMSHCHLGEPKDKATNSTKCSLNPQSFNESDFIALFEPSGKVQGPVLREAIKSLRIAHLRSDLFSSGYVPKIKQSKSNYDTALGDSAVINAIDNPKTPFDVISLVKQMEEECVWPTDKNNANSWGDSNGNFTYCLPLVTRINAILTSKGLSCVFKDNDPSIINIIDQFITQDDNILRIDLSGISFEYKAREIISNAIGRHLLELARRSFFTDKPLLIFIDEAHNFLGKNIGNEDSYAKLDAFELIAKEGRKFGLNICLATQRPRDITEGVLSQIGTLIVHRLTNDRDREIVERTCGEIDKSASAFLPNLKPGEVVIIGNDFPIPLTIKVIAPTVPPDSTGPDYQKHWKGK